MAILEKEVWVGVRGDVTTYYEELGYMIPKRIGKDKKLRATKGAKILVKIDDLAINSSVKVTKICDNPACGKITENKSYRELMSERKNELDFCHPCGNKRARNDLKEKLAKERIGTVNKNNYGSAMIVDKYNDSEDIWVKFEQGNLVHTRWGDFLNGKVKNPFDKTTYGIGYFGEGNYKSNIQINGKHCHTEQYNTWVGMMKRCYDPKYLLKFPTYIDCSVDEEWHNYQVFAKWYDDNIYKVDDEYMELDKDILNKGNKVYSPETCIFVPQRINYLLLKRDAARGECPIGTYFNKEINRYVANGRANNKKTINLGSFDNKEDAFQAYKTHKERKIKDLADQYKNKIPNKLYNALINYKVDILD